jgi:hypothetical protein
MQESQPFLTTEFSAALPKFAYLAFAFLLEITLAISPTFSFFSSWREIGEFSQPP